MSDTPDLPFLSRRDRAGVLYVIQHHDYAGAETYAVPVLQADPDPLLACPSGSDTEAFAKRLGVPTVGLPFRPLRHSGGRRELLRSVGRGLASARDLRRLLRENPERGVVYGTSLRPSLLGTVAAIGMRRQVLWVLTDFMPPPPLRQAVRLLARISRADVVAISQGVADDFAGRSRRLRDRTVVVYPGIDTKRYTPSEASGARVRAIILGQVSPNKRTDLAIEIAARVAAEFPDFELDVVGRAQYREDDFEFERDLHRRVADDPSLAERIRFVGHLTDVREALADASLLLHCRPDEPFGVVFLEAMASGLAVVAPAAAGPTEIVEDGVSGFLYEPGDPADGARQVLRLLRESGAVAQMGAAGRERAERLFSLRAQLDGFDAALARLAS